MNPEVKNLLAVLMSRFKIKRNRTFAVKSLMIWTEVFRHPQFSIFSKSHFKPHFLFINLNLWWYLPLIFIPVPLFILYQKYISFEWCKTDLIVLFFIFIFFCHKDCYSLSSIHLSRSPNLLCWVLSNDTHFIFPSLSSHQRLTHVKQMMDVVPVRICVSSITITLRPAPVHTLWSFRPTNSLVMVRETTFLICHVFSLCRQSTHMVGYCVNHMRF